MLADVGPRPPVESGKCAIARDVAGTSPSCKELLKGCGYRCVVLGGKVLGVGRIAQSPDLDLQGASK